MSSDHRTHTLTVLGWTDDTRILNATLYPDHVQQNTPQFMTALFNIGRIWLGAAIILPPRHIHDPDATSLHDPDNFSTFRPKCIRYNPPGAPGSYVSRFTSHTSHMKLIIRLRKDASPINVCSAIGLHGIHIVCYQQAIPQQRDHDNLSIQGAFGDSMRPSIQGLLEREKLPADLVPGMKCNIYSLSELLNSNGATGAKDKVAIFTKSGADILTADSCKEAILSAIRNGEKTHTADNVNGI